MLRNHFQVDWFVINRLLDIESLWKRWKTSVIIIKISVRSWMHLSCNNGNCFKEFKILNRITSNFIVHSTILITDEYQCTNGIMRRLLAYSTKFRYLKPTWYLNGSETIGRISMSCRKLAKSMVGLCIPEKFNRWVYGLGLGQFRSS